MMNVNMELKNIEELELIFDVMFKKALSKGVKINLNLDIDKIYGVEANLEEEVAVTEVQEYIKEVESKNNTLPKLAPPILRDKVTFARCKHCGVVQVVNNTNTTCYNCNTELPTDQRPCDVSCSCGEEVSVYILGTGVDYVTCIKCNKRHSIRLDTVNNKWVEKKH